MREIKFRGFTVEGIWKHGYLTKMGAYYVIHNGSGGNEFVREDTVGQFTGLKDKNGKEIYEGDIVQRGVIVFHDGKFQGQYYGSGGMYEMWEDDLCQERNIEVVGNIYQNPDLLTS